MSEAMFSSIAYHAIMAMGHYPHLMASNWNAYGTYACILFEFYFIFLIFSFPLVCLFLVLLLLIFGIWLLFAIHLNNNTHRHYAQQYAKMQFFLLAQNFEQMDFGIFHLNKFWGVTNLPPLNRISSRDSRKVRNLREIGQMG